MTTSPRFLLPELLLHPNENWTVPFRREGQGFPRTLAPASLPLNFVDFSVLSHFRVYRLLR